MNITDADFEAQVLKFPGVVLVDFFASWCGPCRMMGPVVESLEKKFAGKAKVVKINVDDNFEQAKKLQISSIPTLVIYKEGKVVFRTVGTMAEDALEQQIKSHL